MKALDAERLFILLLNRDNVFAICMFNFSREPDGSERVNLLSVYI